MHWLPTERFQIKTRVKQPDLVLRPNVRPKHTAWEEIGDMSRYFMGTVDQRGFRISPVIGYRNSFLPCWQGTFTVDQKGAVISVTAGMNSFAVGFSIVWAGGMLFAFCFVLFLMIAFMKNGFFLQDIFPLLGVLGMTAAMLLMLEGMFCVGFWREEKRARRYFEQLYQEADQKEEQELKDKLERIQAGQFEWDN